MFSFSILKGARQCVNKHKFCYSCIFVWSTSGDPVNHERCPVCRADGWYVNVPELDSKINSCLVKCSLKTCKWVGPLSCLSAHRHTTYSSTGSESDKDNELTELQHGGGFHTPSRSSSLHSGATTELSGATSESASTVATPRPTLLENDTRNSGARSSRVTTQRHSTNVGASTQRSRTRSRHRQNSTSPTRRPGVTSTGLPNRLTSRQRLDNGRTVRSSIGQNNQQVQNENVAPVEQTSTTNLTPRPPPNPRPHGQTTRRLPTLPNLVNPNPRNTGINSTSDTNRNVSRDTNTIDSNNNVAEIRELPTTPDTPRSTFEVIAPHRRVTGLNGFGNMRDRLAESRNRLDHLMTAFSEELDRGRQDLTAFQQERERRRQEQLAEVRDLGRRLGQVAQELRGLLTQRRRIRNQIDNLVESATDSD